VFISDNNNHPVEPHLRQAMTCTPMGSPLWAWTTEGVQAAPIVIGENVWLGRHSAILKGVCIGRDSVVALAAVVTRTAPAGSIIGGNPARVLKKLE
jgi:acetyltransferase-like isoleucine patch superfamily enzyme